MNLSAPVAAKAEADAKAYTVGQAAHDPTQFDFCQLSVCKLTKVGCGCCLVSHIGAVTTPEIMHIGLSGPSSTIVSNNGAIVESGGRPPSLPLARSVRAPRLHFIIPDPGETVRPEFYGLATTCVLSEIYLPVCLEGRNEWLEIATIKEND